MRNIPQRLIVAPDEKISNGHCIKFGSYSFGLKESTHSELVGLAGDMSSNLHNATRFVLDNCTGSLRHSMREVLRSYTERSGESLFYQPAILWLGLVDREARLALALTELKRLMPSKGMLEIASLSLLRGAERLISCGGRDVTGEIEAAQQRNATGPVEVI